MGRLTTHVLDLARGQPGNGITVKLFSVEGHRHLVATAVTNDDGRTDDPLLDEETFHAGSYELEFSVGEYFSNSGLPAEDPPFLNEVVVRFSLGDGQDYHVPLLVSPWGYTTYRGS